METLTLCADDYGLNSNVDDGINSLIRAGRLNAVSCMTVRNTLDAVPLLNAITDAPIKVQVGLHLTLTEYAPLRTMPKLAKSGHFPSVGTLLAKSHFRQIDRIEISAEIARQFEAFQQAFGHTPDFVDGHQHIQLFPGIRDEVINLMTTLMGKRKAPTAWVRCGTTPAADLIRMKSPRALLLASMARRQRAKLHNAGLSFNDRFYGVNDFNSEQPFRELMQGWLKMVASRTTSAVIMCHPGQPGSDPADPIAKRRPDELAYLCSDEFEYDLATYHLSL